MSLPLFAFQQGAEQVFTPREVLDGWIFPTVEAAEEFRASAHDENLWRIPIPKSVLIDRFGARIQLVWRSDLQAERWAEEAFI